MRITTKRFKEIVTHCPDESWIVEFRKWEHMPEHLGGSHQGYKGMPNICSIRIIDIAERFDDITGNKWRTFVVEDDFEDEFIGHPSEIVEKFTKDLSDDDFIELLIEVEETPGHFDRFDLLIEECDKSYSDKRMIISVDEEFKWIKQ